MCCLRGQLPRFQVTQWLSVTEQPSMEVAQVLRSTWDNRGVTALAPKRDKMVCAHNFFGRRGAKPILQVTVSNLLEFGRVGHLQGCKKRGLAIPGVRLGHSRVQEPCCATPNHRIPSSHHNAFSTA
jgi:hypothetical protein